MSRGDNIVIATVMSQKVIRVLSRSRKEISIGFCMAFSFVGTFIKNRADRDADPRFPKSGTQTEAGLTRFSGPKPIVSTCGFSGVEAWL